MTRDSGYLARKPKVRTEGKSLNVKRIMGKN